MKTAWTKGLEADAKQEIEAAFNAGGALRERLSFLLAGKMNAKFNENLTDNNYDNVNWAYKQADTQGYIRAMKEISSLLASK